MHKKIWLLILAVAAQYLYGADIQITGKELALHVAPEYNRTFGSCWDLSTVGALIFNNRYTVKGGFALGSVGDGYNIRFFSGGEAALPFKVPLFVSIAYNYDGLPEYECHTHSVLPLISFKWQRAGFSLGMNFRSTVFFNESPVFEPILSAAIYVHIINNDLLQLGLRLSNFNDFTYGNLGSYFFNLYSTVRLNARLSFVNEIELHQSGSIALAANFYGFVYRGGVKLTW